MLRRKVYYLIKPYVPRSVRLAIRGVFARRKLAAVRDVWPVLPSAGSTPCGWPGWPAGKRFAVLLTHDVEGLSGLARVRKLAELEMSLGFRSSFNFIPEGEYSVPSELRTWLTDNGFEVGVHDLHHNGTLYRSRDDFFDQAPRINHYLKEWGAVGFRAGFMYHNLVWLHELDIDYDLSTFDTDPFEPQPDGAETIFPFWVELPRQGVGTPNGTQVEARTTRRGYLELPYTLAQDSTLFLLLKEKTPQIWNQKADWVAERGGLVLINVHPDYIRFPGEKSTADTFPVDYYADFLRHVRDQHASDYWHGIPHDLVSYLAPLKPAHRTAANCPAIRLAMQDGPDRAQRCDGSPSPGHA